MYTFKNVIQTLKITPLIFLFSFFPAQSSPTKISILQTSEHPALNQARQGLVKELETLGYKEGKNLTLEYQSAQGSPALAVQIAQKFASEHPDLIVAIATPAAQAAFTATKNKGIPVVFTAVSDPLGAKLVTNLKTPESHVTGVSDFVSPELKFKFFMKLNPTLKTLGIVYNTGEDNSTALNKLMEKAAEEEGLKLVLAAASKTSDVMGASQSLCGKVDAIFINNDNTALSAFKSVVRAAQACGIPAFVSDLDVVDQGAAAALGPNQFELGRQTARMVDSILKHPKAPLPAVEFPEKTEEFVKAP
ncbi:MAG TPA: ABC transporter substrate-binding protein [Alphaproteobacteria bacterium]|nr:ABC transporter substrate-binding protein [Alphaproteobacteria bacterium]